MVADLARLESRCEAAHAPVLRQALGIVLDNAIRYSVPGTIHISAEISPSVVSVRVRDEGPGKRGRPDTGTLLDASGLGLQLCEALLRHAGGDIEVEQAREGGTSVVLRIPATEGAC